MAQFLFFAVGFALFALLTLILPLLSFVRARQAQHLAREVLTRIEVLERAVAELARSQREIARPAASGTRSTASVVQPVPPSPVVTERAADRVPGGSAPLVASPPTPAPALSAAPPTPASPRLPPPWISSPPEPQQSPAFDLEQVIGGRWLLYAGIAAVVLGVSYFVKFAFDNGWVSEPMRVAAGIAAGLLLIAVGMRFVARGLDLFGQGLAGGGIVVLYLSVYAALHFYQLIDHGVAFALMIVITAGAAWLAHQQKAQPVAMLALLGGFATPLLVGGERDVQVVLFTYMAILISGTAVLARYHGWPLLSAAAYVCTFALVVMWSFASYEPHKWLTTQVFLTVYVAIFGYLLYELRMSARRDAVAQFAIAALATAPLTYHLASIILLNERPAAWLVYMVLFTAAGLVVSQRTGAAWVRLLTLILVGLPMMFWLESLQYPRWYTPAVLVTIALYAMHLAAQWEAIRDDPNAPIPDSELLHAQLNGLLLPFTLYVFLEKHAAWASSWMVAGAAAWNALLVLAANAYVPRVKLPFIALSGTLAAIALVLAFDGPVVALGWAADGVFLFWLAARERSQVLQFGGSVLIAMGAVQLVQLMGSGLPAGDAAFFNARALASALVIVLLSWLAWQLAKDAESETYASARDVLIVVANILAIITLSAEIHALFVGSELDARVAQQPWEAVDARLAEQVTLSVTWALYAVVLIAVGMRRQYAPARYMGIVLLGVTLVKVLAHDIAGLDRLYRMMSVLGVGILLLVASYLYQRRAKGNTHSTSSS